MEQFSRLARVIKGWLQNAVNPADRPAIILREAHESMRRELQTWRQPAVEAEKARKELAKELKSQRSVAAGLEFKAEMARKMGDAPLELELLEEKSARDAAVDALARQMEAAVRAEEHAKAALRSAQSRVRQHAAEQLSELWGKKR